MQNKVQTGKTVKIRMVTFPLKVDENNNLPKQINGEHVEHVGENTDILPWNIVEDPPETNRTELYKIEGSWRLISNQVTQTTVTQRKF